MGDDRRNMKSIHELEQPPRRASPLGLVALTWRSDEDLLELLSKRQDEAAFDELYRRYSRAVYGVLRRLIGDGVRSEEVVHEAFTNAWRAAAGYSREQGPATDWLFEIARDAAIDALPLRPAATTSVGAGVPVDEPGPDQGGAAAHEGFRIHAAVDRLPDQERTAIELAYFDGLSQSEVAARLGAPLGAVEKHTRRGLAHLRDRLAEGRVRS